MTFRPKKMALHRFLRPLRLSSVLGRFYTSTTVEADEPYDLVIAGGGVVGSALALNVGREPSLSRKKVLLLDSRPSPVKEAKLGDHFSNRISVLSLGTIDLLKKIGIWHLVEEMRAKPFTRIHVWDAYSDARVVFDNQKLQDLSATDQEILHDLDEPSDDIIASSYQDHSQSEHSSAMGYIVENRVLFAALNKALDSLENVVVFQGSKLKAVNKTENNMELTLDNGETLSTKLLVGSNPHTRQLCGFNKVGWSYDQSAVVATLNTSETGGNQSIWQRLLPTGPITMLPLSPTVSSLLWCTSPAHAQSLVEMSQERFVDAINAAFWDALPQSDLVANVTERMRDILTLITTEAPPPRQMPPTVSGVDNGSRTFFPIALEHSPYYIKPRVALIGDACHKGHPATGLSLHFNLGDVDSLTSALLAADARGADWGSLLHLLEYETTRQKCNVPALAAFEGLGLFSQTSLLPLVLLRSCGLQFTNSMPQFKDSLVSYTRNLQC